MGIIFPFAVCLYCSSVGSWTDPTTTVTFQLSTNASSVLKVGDVVEFSCTATGLLSTSTIEWRKVVDNIQTREDWGRSPLKWTKTITAEDNGSELYCGASLSSNTEYYAKSERIALQVEGVNTLPSKPDINGERIWVSVRPEASQYKVGDTVEYVCNIENMGYRAVELKQAKGNLEYQIYFGYQTGYRWISQNLTMSDDGTTIFCSASITSHGYGNWNLFSEPYLINVVP